MPNSTVSTTYVATDTVLGEVIARCRQQSFVAIDTEFVRTDTYYPLVGLVQIFDGDGCYLIDPLAVTRFQPLVDLLLDPQVLKVFHACSEDLEVFQYALGAMPTPIFDTQVAAAVLGTGFSMSYARLVEHYLGVTVPKEETRSNWLRRPLSSSQLEYAALDVTYLAQVFERQQVALVESNKTDWVAEECRWSVDDIATSVDPEKAFLRVKGAARLRPAELNRLRALCAWREHTARGANMPRNRVVEEKSLMAIARAEVLEETDLEADLSPGRIRKYGAAILAAVASANRVPDSAFPPPMDDGQGVSNEEFKRLKKIVADRAVDLSIAPEMLARRRHIEDLLRSGGADEYALPESLEGWRRDAIGEHLLAALRGQ